jgi:hypothetical protein
MSKTGSSSKGTNRQHSRKESEPKGDDNVDYEMISKVDSNAALIRRNSVFDQNPHYQKSIIQSILRPSDPH